MARTARSSPTCGRKGGFSRGAPVPVRAVGTRCGRGQATSPQVYSADSSARLILSELGRKCIGGHQHAALASGRAATAAVYPPTLRRAILHGADAQRRWEGQAAPS
eukprot:6264146-Alexandrium_andersonii.AAC.2